MNQNTILELFRYHQDRNLTDYKALKAAFWHGMEKAGAKLLGAGWYSTVWTVGDSVYKINSGSNGGRDGFVHWVDGIRGYSANPHLPRVGAIAVDDERYCIELEPLTPLDDTDARLMGAIALNQTTVKMLAGYVAGFPDLVGAIDLAYQIVQVANPEHDYGPNPDLFSKLSSIDFSDWGGFSNLMKRGDCLVLNDPIAYSAESIEPYNIKLRQSLGLAA